MPEQDHSAEPERHAPIERARLEGALEALGALHEDLTLRRDEARDEPAREVYDEMMTVLDSLAAEYRRRHAALPTAAERERMRARLFAPTPESTD